MTNTVITRTDRFKAAASGAGHSFIAANYGHDIYQKWYSWELGPPWENREAVRPAFTAVACRQGHDADDLPRRPRRLERPGAQRRALLPVAARHAASTPSSSSIRACTTAAGARSSTRTTCVRVRAMVRQVPEVSDVPSGRRGRPPSRRRSRRCGRTGRCAPSSSAANTSSRTRARSITCGCLATRSASSRATPRRSRSCARPSRCKPEFPHLHEDLGSVLALQRRFEEAVPCFERAIRLEPRLPLAHKKLGEALAALGRGREADAAFEEFFDRDAGRGKVALALDHLRAGRKDEAFETLRAALREDADNVDALRVLAQLYWKEDKQLSRRRGAAAAGRRSSHPGIRWPGRCSAASCRSRIGTPRPWSVTARRSGWTPPAPSPGRASASPIRTPATWTRRSRRSSASIALRPGNAERPAELRRTRSRPAATRRRRCAPIAPPSPRSPTSARCTGAWPTSRCSGSRTRRSPRWSSRSRATDLSESADIHFRFALAKAYEDRGDYDRAWHYYDTGNQRQRKTVFHDPVAMELRHEEIAAVFTPELFEKFAGAGPRVAGADLHRRPAALGLDADRADPREPQPGRGHGRAADAGAPRLLDRPLPRGQEEVPGVGSRPARPGPQGLRPAVPRGSRGLPLDRPAVLHGQDAEQLLARRAHPPDPAEREDHQRATASVRQLPRRLQAAVRPRASTSPTTWPSLRRTTASTTRR